MGTRVNPWMPMFLKNYNLNNAIAFILIFLLMFEAITLSNEEQSTENKKPQWLIITLSIILGSVTGFDKTLLNKPIKR